VSRSFSFLSFALLHAVALGYIFRVRLFHLRIFLFLRANYLGGGLGVGYDRKFDTLLRTQNPEWGVRNLEDVVDAAEKEGLELLQTVDMPANNLSLLFRKK
jgi:hypothetical protein